MATLLDAGGLEAAAGDGVRFGNGAESCTREHLQKLARASIDVLGVVLWAACG
jgi:hypothetical protein